MWRTRKRPCGLRIILFLAFLLHRPAVPAAEVRLDLAGPDTNGWPRFSLEGGGNRLVRLLAAPALPFAGHEVEVARARDRFTQLPDFTAGNDPLRFYRAVVSPWPAGLDWKNQLAAHDEPFRSPEAPFWQPESRWVKFALLLGATPQVVFQDSTRWPFHYDFAVARLPQFAGLTRPQFDAVSLRTNGQQVVLGAVLWPPNTNFHEVGLQFVGLDAYPPEVLARWYRMVRATLPLPAGVQDYYLPVFEQAGVAQQHAAWLAAQGVRVSSAARWIAGDECYAAGWSLGRLKFVPAAEINDAYRAGTLRFTDILLTDAVPAEVPPLAGIIALTPATPNSHVALLAKSFGVPFVYFADPARREELRAWDGAEVALSAVDLFGGCDLRVTRLAAPLPPELREEILKLKAPPKLNLTPKAVAGTLTRPADALRPADVKFVGGKAANFGLLRRAIPTNSPSPALAVTFDLWDAYLDQPLPGHASLRAAIAARLAPFAWPPDMNALKTALAEIREWIEDDADFTSAQRAAVLAALQDAGFAPDRKIRFRSSTNVEDTEQFSGAGLYDSFSGCLADELDGDTQGPSACDPAEPRERGVFRAMRKVYASFYNDNAYLERLRRGVDEATVGMALLVHHSTPDEIELANGVATITVNKQWGSRYLSGDLVTQAGAVSVTNPDTTARPERIRAQGTGGTDVQLDLVDRSALVPLGDHVLNWPAEYRQLWALLEKSARAYEAEFPAKQELLLDFEYKKVAPDGELRVKQIRELPRPDTAARVPAYLLGDTNRYVVFQGERGELLANHRLKAQLALATRSLKLVSSNLTASIFTGIGGELLAGSSPTSLAGTPPTSLPAYSFHRFTDATEDRWRLGAGADERRYALRVTVPTQVDLHSSPLRSLGEVQVELTVNYATRQPALGWEPRFTNTPSESVLLVPAQRVTAESLRQTRRFTAKGVTVETAFYWPAPPKGASAGYTAPLQAWVETVIAGLTSEPITLRGEYSQTYLPGHHNFWESFLFDPTLEPGVPDAVRAELAAKNVRALIITGGFGTTDEALVWGADGTLRPL
jgi:hypothetical protein